MYEPIDRHGFYLYSSEEELKRVKKENKELKEEIQLLQEKLNKYEFIIYNKELSFIDGHVCYKDFNNIEIASIEITSDFPSLKVDISGDIIYRDIDTDNVIAVRHVDNELGKIENV